MSKIAVISFCLASSLAGTLALSSCQSGNDRIAAPAAASPEFDERRVGDPGSPNEASSDRESLPPPASENARAFLDQLRRVGDRRVLLLDIERNVFTWDDIEHLLVLADDTGPAPYTPINPLSSFMTESATVGVVALWVVEAIRCGVLRGDPVQEIRFRFPTLNCHLIAGPGAPAMESPQAVAARAYRAWWREARGVDPVEAADSSPLAGSNVHWR